MPTFMGTTYRFTYDLGDAHQRGVTKRFSQLRREVQGVLGRGAHGTRKETIEDRAIASFEFVLSGHPLTLERDSRAFSIEHPGEKLQRLKEILGYLGDTEFPIIHYT